MITGISGGSITASHYAANIDKYIRSFDTPAGELLTFIKTVDLRRQVLTKGVSVSDVLKTHLFKNNATIESVSDRVELVIFGTSLKTGNCIAFRRNSIESSSYDGDAGKLKVEATIPVNSIRLRDLIQASAGFPPFFPPLRLNRLIFVSKPSVQQLGLLSDEEIADGGIRDNLGLEWYKANVNTDDDDVLPVVSDAGQFFDWDSSSNTGQSINSWINRLLRAVNIQMDRLSQLDKSSHGAHFNATFIQFKDRSGLPTHESDDSVPHNRTITSGVAESAESIPTDLVPIKAGQAYAIVRFGYDLAKLKMQEAYSVRAGKPGSLNDEDEFWKKLLQADITCLDGEATTSLASLIARENSDSTKWRYNPVTILDYWRQLPLSNTIRWLLIAILVSVAGLAAAGVRPTVAFGWSLIRPYVYAEPSVEYFDFRSKVQSTKWDDACKAIDGKTVLVRGKFLSKRGDVLTIKLDQLEYLARVKLSDPKSASALPPDANQNRDHFLVLSGKYLTTEYDPASLNLISGELQSSLEDRPEAWDQ